MVTDLGRRCYNETDDAGDDHNVGDAARPSNLSDWGREKRSQSIARSPTIEP
jgi:hypothetical protein